MDLFSKFTGGSYYQGSRFVEPSGHEPVEYGQHERGCFAGAGLGQAHDVASLEDCGDCFQLNGGRGFVSLGLHALKDGPV
jgi:hypothetical protein